MKKYKTVKKVIKEKEIKSITCDICGKTYEVHNEIAPVLTFSTTGGYSTSFDGVHIEIDICNNCMKDIINGKPVKFKKIFTKNMW